MSTTFQIAAVARMTGLSSDTIRAWERRYRFVEPLRNAAGVRLYSKADVERLEFARSALTLGHSIGQIAGLSDADLRQLIEGTGNAGRGDAAGAPAARILADILGALERYDLARAEWLLNSAALLFTPTELIVELLSPLMGAVGDRWEAKTFSVAQEHFASHLVRSLVGSIMRMRPRSGERGMLFATPPGESHEFGILFAACLAAVHGFKAWVLGANVPAKELLRAAAKLRATHVVLGLVADENSAASRAYVREIRAALPNETNIYVGGNAASRLRADDLPEGVEPLASLAEFVTRVGRPAA
ncbi:MAG: MerR family transcriptional regulator [Candidatus Velthaea sp.]